MSLLEGKTAMVFGVANERSIAWGITQAFHREGARIGLSYAGEALERRVRPLAESIGCEFVAPCDVAQDEAIERVAQEAAEAFGQVDILVHAIAFANRDELNGPYYNTSRAGFHLAMDISVYSFTALARAFQPLLRPGGALLTLTYYGSEKVAPHYNVMGVAKAALEASVRYLAYDFGRQGVRVNAISAGPIRTLAAAGVSGFKDMLRQFAEVAPLRQNVTTEDVGGTALYLK
jgi:enoyl-[acyl-carrier protein] reductase I